jgi:hypothetical protein
MEKRMRTAIVAVMAGALTAAAAPQTPVIGITEGKGPAHRLTIVSAYSCGYCRVLDEQAMPELRSRWIGRGVQIESVPVSISPTDAAAAIAATCGDMRRYARRSTILFRSQGTILGNWNGASDKAKDAAVAAQKRGSALRVAEVAGIVSLAPSLDLDTKQLRACLSDPARLDRQRRRERLADVRWHVVGTPSVFLDGRPVGSTWQSVRTALVRAAGR